MATTITKTARIQVKELVELAVSTDIIRQSVESPNQIINRINRHFLLFPKFRI